MRLRAVAAALLALVVLSPVGPSAAASTPQKGISFVGHSVHAYDGAAPEQAMADLAATGATWVSVVVTRYQQAFDSTAITATSQTPSDAGVEHMIDAAHSLGLAVMLKPHIDLSNDPQHWRGDIGDGFTPAKRKAWFASYAAFIDHYAQIAQSRGVEEFSVGCELEGITTKAASWRTIVAGVRSRFTGTLTYAAWPGEEQHITWWDALDAIGVDAYYPLTSSNDPTPSQLLAGWRSHVTMLRRLSAHWGRPILVTEIGYVSQDGTNRVPYSWKLGALDLQEQADCYQAAFEALWQKPWLAGMFWWNWNADPNVGGPQNTGFTPHGKPAEDVLRTWYS